MLFFHLKIVFVDIMLLFLKKNIYLLCSVFIVSFCYCILFISFYFLLNCLFLADPVFQGPVEVSSGSRVQVWGLLEDLNEGFVQDVVVVWSCRDVETSRRCSLSVLKSAKWCNVVETSRRCWQSQILIFWPSFIFYQLLSVPLEDDFFVLILGCTHSCVCLCVCVCEREREHLCTHSCVCESGRDEMSEPSWAACCCVRKRQERGRWSWATVLRCRLLLSSFFRCRDEARELSWVAHCFVCLCLWDRERERDCVLSCSFFFLSVCFLTRQKISVFQFLIERGEIWSRCQGQIAVQNCSTLVDFLKKFLLFKMTFLNVFLNVQFEYIYKLTNCISVEWWFHTQKM